MSPNPPLPAQVGTAVSSDTESAGSEPRVTSIRWVFPEDRLTALGDKLLLGRGECDVVLPGSEISRKHALIEHSPTLCTVRDLGSTNGVYVNGLKRSSAPLLVGDVVRCGEWIGVVGAENLREEFGEIAPGLFGGTTLANAVAPIRKLGADRPVIIQGKSGTGKEGVARAIHHWGQPARPGDFVAEDCATLKPELAESALFGHVKGAFTGAHQAHTGLFVSAEKGTLFLDEVLELAAPVQSKLLRALQERQVRPLGAKAPIPFDVRVIVAAQSALEAAVAQGTFRADVLARLRALTVVLPTLRERREDIIPLARHFIARFTRGKQPPEIHFRLAEALCVYDWPYNVRELQQEVGTMVELHEEEGTLRRSHLPARILEVLNAISGDSDGARLAAPPGEGERRSEVAPSKQARRPANLPEDIEALQDALREHETLSAAARALDWSIARAKRVSAALLAMKKREPS